MVDLSYTNLENQDKKSNCEENSKKYRIQKTLDILPRKPGVYIFRDSKGKVIYIGKAKNIANRVRSYFQSKGAFIQRVYYFVDEVDTIDYIVTDNEVEALVLESNLVKRNRPKYNIELKDDKSYPYIAITYNDKYPRVFMTRNRNLKDARYFGPYTNVKSIKKTIDVLRKLFQIRDCKKSKPGKGSKSPCLNYHIGLCSAPCINDVSPEAYKSNIKYIELFLKGKDKSIIDSLTLEMEEYAKKEEFEKAARVKEKIDAINRLYQEQKISLGGENTWDVIALSKEEELAVVNLMTYKDGELFFINNFTVRNPGRLTEEEILSEFIRKYYLDINNVPSTIYIPIEIEDMDLISHWLSQEKGKKIEIKVPKIGEKKKIMEMAIRNSRLYLEKRKFEKNMGYGKAYRDLNRLKEILGLEKVPRRIECYDISNLKDSFPVGSMVVFVDAAPYKEGYRHFKIKTVEGQDDCKMIGEVLARRIKYLEESKIDIEDSFYVKPDLIVVDGGKGQFNTAYTILGEKGFSDIEVISIAKKEEVIFTPKHREGIRLNLDDPSLRIIVKIRDEAHRFAVEYHRKMRGEYMVKSFLDEIKGIGEKKKRYIFERFKTMEELCSASIKDIADVKGLSYKDAVNIYESIHK